MTLPPSVDRDRAALTRILAGLFGLLGWTDGVLPGRISRALHRAIAAVLRPAESAARRLIVILARNVRVKASPPRPMPANLVRAGRGEPRLAFPLFDPRKRFLRPRRAPDVVVARPRITFFGAGDARRFSFGREPAPGDDKADGLATSAGLARRLQALKAALDDLPRQARRLVRALARRAQSPRLRLQGPLRPGLAPGWRERPLEEIDRVLHRCDWLARAAPAADTS